MTIHVRRGAFSALCGVDSPGALVGLEDVELSAPPAGLCRRCLRRAIGRLRAGQRRALEAGRRLRRRPAERRTWETAEDFALPMREAPPMPPAPAATPARPAAAVVAPGERYGRWLVLRLVVPRKAAVRCECGAEAIVSVVNLVRGHSTGCRRCGAVARWSGPAGSASR